MRAPNGVESELAWEEDDPCAAIMQRTGWTEAQIDRAGIFDAVDKSFLVMRCTTNNMLGTWVYTPGHWALSQAHAELVRGNHTGCVFTAAPRQMPIFGSPFPINPLPSGFQMSNTGYDFATLPGSPPGSEPQVTLDVRVYSQRSRTPNSCMPPSDGCSRVVSYRGQDRSDASEDNYQGFTWAMNAGSPVLAAGDGVVIAVRARPVTGCHTATQNELYVRHQVGESFTSRYLEIFVTYYAHLDVAAGIQVGSIVTRGQVIGHVGNSGCTAGRNQLHFAVLRASNTAREYRPVLDTTPGIYGANNAAPDNSVARIDPWGWWAVQTQPHVDPGGYAWYHHLISDMGPNGGNRTGGGALSIGLFLADAAPPRPCDENHRAWAVEGGASITNPYANCTPPTP
jgi:murein DD-endopeptidase MepM/ murein hydrolase activator NlpD